MDLCEKCGVELQVGMWPFCHGDQAEHGYPGSQRHWGFEPHIDEHLPGGCEVGYNLQGERVVGTFIDSRSTRNAIMKEHGLVSGGKISRRHKSKVDYDAMAEKVVRNALNDWRQR